MKIEKIAISKLKFDPRNARVHDERNIEAVVVSLKEFGQQRPIIIDEEEWVTSEHYYQAMKFRGKHATPSMIEYSHLANLADFLTVASKLILIKSKSLLPLLVLSDEEEEEIVDLEKQLMEYKKFKDASLNLGKIMESDKYSVSRESFLNLEPVFSPPSDLEVVDLMMRLIMQINLLHLFFRYIHVVH